MLCSNGLHYLPEVQIWLLDPFSDFSRGSLCGFCWLFTHEYGGIFFKCFSERARLRVGCWNNAMNISWTAFVWYSAVSEWRHKQVSFEQHSHTVPMLTLIFNVLFNITWCYKNKITHNIAPINLHSSIINLTSLACHGVRLCCLSQSVFRNIAAIANSAIVTWVSYVLRECFCVTV